MDLFDDPYADIVSSHTKQAAPTDDPYADIVSAHRKVAPSGPSAKSQWAQMVQSDGEDYGHGFKEMDVDFNGKPTRIREDGAVWLNGKWTDPQTAGDAGGMPPSAPERDGFTSVSALRAKGYKAGPTGNPDIPILKAHGFRDDEIQRITKAPSYVPGAFQGLEDAFGKGTRGGEAQAGIVGRLSQGLTNVGMKAAQLGSRMPGVGLGGKIAARVVGSDANPDFEPEYMDAVARVKAQQIAANKQKGDISILGIDPLEAAGQMLIPVPGAGLGKGGSLLARLGGAAARGAIGGAMQPQSNVRYDQSGRSNFGTQLAGQAGAGALAGPVVESAGSALGRLLSKKTTIPAPKDVTKLSGDIEAAMLKAAESDAAQLESIAQAGGKRAKEALSLAASIRSAGADAPKLLTLSAQARRLQEKVANDEAYAQVGNAVKGIGDSPIPNTIAAIDDVISELKRNNYPGLEGAISELKDFRTNMLPKSKTVPTGLLDESGNAITQTVTTKPDLSYGTLSNTRATLKDKLRAIYNANPTGGEGAKGINSDQYQRIAKALETDLDASVRSQKPEAIPILDSAQKQYRAYKEKWGESTLNKALSDTSTPDELLKKYVGGAAKSDRAQNVKAALTPAGVESTKFQILQNALDAADGNPSRFVDEIKKSQNATGVFFEGDDLARLDGLKKIMLFSSRAGKVATSGAGAGLGSMVGPGTAVIGAAVAPKVGLFGHIPSDEVGKVASKLMLTAQGQKLLLAANKYQSRGPQWDNLMAEIEDYLARTGGIAGGQTMNGSPKRK